MPKRMLTVDVYDAAVQRMQGLYSLGHRIVVSFSGGKDSTVALEVCIEAARRTGRLPVDVVMRDEEIMFPGTFEYCERVMNRPEVSFVWLVMGQPIVNAFNRSEPYWWVFDDLARDRWVRQPPPWAVFVRENSITEMTTPGRFPADPSL